MKKALLFITILILGFSAKSQVTNVTGMYLKALNAIVIKGDTVRYFYTDAPDDTIVSKSYVDYLKARLDSIDISQGGHDPVSISSNGYANGLRISGQVLDLLLSSSTQNGALSSSDWTLFNSKLSSVARDNTLAGNGTTGSPLRVDTVTIATKHDLTQLPTVNTTYGISSEIAVDGANIRLTGSDNTTDDVKIRGTGSVTVTRTDANTITVNGTASSGTVQTLSSSGDPGNISISDGNTITLNVNDNDYDPTNEIQHVDTFRVVNNILELSLSEDGQAKKTVDLSAYVNAAPQTLSLINNSLTISQGNSVDLSGYANTDSQNLALGIRTGTSQPITISGGTGIILDVADNDNDSINEIQTLSLTGVDPTITLSDKDNTGGGNIVVKGTGAASVSYAGDTITINSVSGTVVNAFTATVPVISTTMSVTYPTPFPSADYFLNFNVYYDQVIGGKNARVDNAIYDFAKTASGFSFKVDTIAGYVELFASDTVNVYPFEYSEADPTVSAYTKALTSDTNVLNAVKNVDGTGSGLDADLLDGQHGSYYATSTHDHSGVYQPLDGDLTAIAGLSGTSGLVKKTAADTYQLDTNTYLTGNQTVTLSGAVTGSGTTSISTTLSDNTATYAKIGTDLKSSNTVSSTVNLSSGGIGKITLSANTAFTFTNFELNKTYLLVVTANNYTASFAQSAKHVLVEGNATIGTTGVYYISLTCIDATSGSEKLLTVIMKGA